MLIIKHKSYILLEMQLLKRWEVSGLKEVFPNTTAACILDYPFVFHGEFFNWDTTLVRSHMGERYAFLI